MRHPVALFDLTEQCNEALALTDDRLNISLDAADGVAVTHHGHLAADGRPLRLDGGPTPWAHIKVPHLDGRVRAPARHPVALQVEAPHLPRMTGQCHDGPGECSKVPFRILISVSEF